MLTLAVSERKQQTRREQDCTRACQHERSADGRFKIDNFGVHGIIRRRQSDTQALRFGFVGDIDAE